MTTNRKLNDENSIKKIGERAFLQKVHYLIDKSSKLDFDDASGLELPSGQILVINVDMLVKKTDVPEGMSNFQMGAKAAVMSISDIIAKGVLPMGCLLSMGIPDNTDVTCAEEIVKGVKETCNRFGAKFIGGDLNKTDDIIVDIVAFGISTKNEIVARKGAKHGDIIFTTGPFGWTRLGFSIIFDNFSAPEKIKNKALSSIYEPDTSILFLDLFKAGIIEVSMDSSDGLGATLRQLSSINRLGIKIYALPIDAELRDFAIKNKLDILDLVFNGGEEFEIVFATRPANKAKLLEITNNIGLKIYEIGVFDSSIKDIVIETDNKTLRLVSNGYEHFKS